MPPTATHSVLVLAKLTAVRLPAIHAGCQVGEHERCVVVGMLSCVQFPYTLPQDGYKWRKRGTILIRGHKCSLEAEDTLIITYYGGEHNHGPITTVVASTHTPSGTCAP